MTHEYKIQKIGGPYIQKIRNHQAISTILIIANVLFFITAIVILCSCEPAVDPTRQFLIRKGDHYASPTLSETVQAQTLVFDARFNESAIYKLDGEYDQSDLNKLMGFCDCNSLPHENSARFAWAWNNNQLEIYAYTYQNGTRYTQFIGTVTINEYNHFELELTSDQYVFTLNDLPAVTMKRGSTCKTGLYFKLWPYFGGHVAAPQDVVIDIKPTY